MKTVWITSIVSSEDIVKNLFSKLKTYGIDGKGHFWVDNLEKMEWISAREELIKPDTSLWVILASEEDLNTPSIRYGLSLLTLTVQANKGLSFPIVILLTQGSIPSDETLPTPLKGAEFLSVNDPGLGAKLVAKVHTPVKSIDSEYRLDVYANPQTGQWFEIGPNTGQWSGAMFGIDKGEITFHGVGPKGTLPGQSVLNYPSKGLKLNLGKQEYTAWSVKNELDNGTSYFVKVKGFPGSILFGSFSTEDETDVYALKIS